MTKTVLSWGGDILSSEVIKPDPLKVYEEPLVLIYVEKVIIEQEKRVWKGISV